VIEYYIYQKTGCTLNANENLSKILNDLSKKGLIMIKQAFIILSLVLLGVIMLGCTYRAFIFQSIYEEGRPPSDPDARLNAGATYSQTFAGSIGQASINGSKMDYMSSIFVRKPYEVLYIKEISCEWEGNTCILLRARKFRLTDEYRTRDGWYLHPSVYFFKFNPKPLFKGKKIGDEFKFRLKFIYSFDDEPENIQFLEYNVEVYKDKYVSPFIGFDGF